MHRRRRLCVRIQARRRRGVTARTHRMAPGRRARRTARERGGLMASRMMLEEPEEAPRADDPGRRRQRGQARRAPRDDRAAGVHRGRGGLGTRSAERPAGCDLRNDPHGCADAHAEWVRDGQALPRAGPWWPYADHLRHRGGVRKRGGGRGVRQRCRRLHLHSRPPRDPAGEGDSVRRPVRPDPRPTAFARVDHRAQLGVARQRCPHPGRARQRQRWNFHPRRARPHRIGQSIGRPSVRLQRGGAHRAPVCVHDRTGEPRRAAAPEHSRYR